MKANSIRRLDGQGRIILPAHIRKALNLSQDSAVTITLKDGGILIKPAEERCCICGTLLEGNDGMKMESGNRVCSRCVQIIKEEVEKW
jgi:AbrB family looped-hinge helix DNA binding protein